jgi:hypothetical protein
MPHTQAYVVRRRRRSARHLTARTVCTLSTIHVFVCVRLITHVWVCVCVFVCVFVCAFVCVFVCARVCARRVFYAASETVGEASPGLTSS